MCYLCGGGEPVSRCLSLAQHVLQALDCVSRADGCRATWQATRSLCSQEEGRSGARARSVGAESLSQPLREGACPLLRCGSILAGQVTVAQRVALETLVLPRALGGPSHPPLGTHSPFSLMATDARKLGHPLGPGLTPVPLSVERPRYGHLPPGPGPQLPPLCCRRAWGKLGSEAGDWT